nr:MAG TPA: helix-turn-helix XRE-family like protein [Caudoviricetes sp.]
MMNRIKAARKKKGYSQRYVAYALGITPPSVSAWESGASKPNAKNMQALSELYGVPVDYLMGDDDAEKEKAPAEADAEDLGKLTFLERLALTCFRHLPEEDRAEILKEMIERGANVEKDDEK